MGHSTISWYECACYVRHVAQFCFRVHHNNGQSSTNDPSSFITLQPAIRVLILDLIPSEFIAALSTFVGAQVWALGPAWISENETEPT